MSLATSTKQSYVALSTTEVEFLALSEGTKLMLWLRCLLSGMDCTQKQSALANEDNQGAAVWATKGIRHAKHVSIRKNFLREIVQEGIIHLSYFQTEDTTADILTKPLLRIKFENHRDQLGIVEIASRSAGGGVDV